ncbi:hypothetical protein PIB30_042660 [Stylosanthes scabra]|uniref:Uncharacterized protein n=1 Tax=Stylosanthes scabra TaxID=79078 RepID=A0ABU6SGB2_9FABA|nr:hypothetical protein [Stylosanthes scabra]
MKRASCSRKWCVNRSSNVKVMATGVRDRVLNVSVIVLVPSFSLRSIPDDINLVPIHVSSLSSSGSQVSTPHDWMKHCGAASSPPTFDCTMIYVHQMKDPSNSIISRFTIRRDAAYHGGAYVGQLSFWCSRSLAFPAADRKIRG